MNRSTHSLSRRSVLRVAGLGLAATASTGWFRALECALAAAEPSRAARRHCILLWMAGGPSQLDTFDMKPGHANGGEFQEIATRVPGVRISQHLPKIAQQMDKIALVRSLTTTEGDHARGTYLVRTGARPGTGVRYPTMGSSLSKELGDEAASLPNYFAINAFAALNPDAYGPGFLGPKHAAAAVVASPPEAPEGFARLRVDNLSLPEGVDADRDAQRRQMWDELQRSFLREHPDAAPLAHDTVYRRAFRMIDSRAATEAFELSDEPVSLREAYGRGPFGQGCLVARRLIERGVPLVEVTLGGFDNGGLGWDTHQDNFATVRRLSAELDAGWGTLLADLDDRGLLDHTTILWIGEFGRTPQINPMAGRDNYPKAWTCAMAGGGIQGGQAYGKTSRDGTTVEENPVGVGHILCTLCHALGIDPATENLADGGRPIRIAEGEPIRELLAS
jgi:hypothetical protein